jgi:hypothetical protein
MLLPIPTRARCLRAVAVLVALTLSPVGASAVSVSFGDSARTWPGHGNGTGDDARDTIGTPDLLGGTAHLHDGLLAQVTLDYRGPFSLVGSGPGSVIAGDLFIDAGADGAWDFVVKLVAGPHTAVASYASAAILDVRGQAESYLLSGADDTGHWRGFGIRDRHPYAWDGGGAPIGTASVTAPDPLASGLQTLRFDLGGGLAVGEQFLLGFAASCGNDVLFERIVAPVPEPSAALVFAAGLLLAARRPPRPRS